MFNNTPETSQKFPKATFVPEPLDSSKQSTFRLRVAGTSVAIPMCADFECS